MMALYIIIGYLLLLIGLGVVSKKMFRGTAADYFVASQSIGPVVLLMSVFGTTMTAFALVGSTGEAYRAGIGTYGKLASWSGLVHAAVFFVVGIRLWAYGKRYGYVTQIEYFRDRFQSSFIGYLLFPILVGLVIPYVLTGILGAGSVVQAITAGAFPKVEAFQYPDKELADKQGIKAELDAAKRVYLTAAVAAAQAKATPEAAPLYATVAAAVAGGKPVRVPWDKLPELKAQRELPEGDAMILAFDQAATRFEATAADMKKSDDWKVRTAVAGSYRNRAREIHREAKLFIDQGLIGIKPDKIPDPLNGGIPRWLSGLVICLVVLFYVFFGGLRGAAWANTFQTVVFMATGVVTFFFIAGKLGGAKAASEMVMEWNAAAMTRENVNPVAFFSYCLVPLSVGMFPHLFQHWLTAKNARAFRLTCVAHPIFIAIVWVPCVLIGVWATAAVMPGAADMSLVVPIDHPPNTELAMIVKKLAQPALAGLLSAGILAAIMSSLDSQFLCLGTMFTNDIVMHIAGRDRFSDKQKVLIARWFIVAIVAVIYGLSLLDARRVFTLGVWCFSGFAGLFPIIFLSLYWRRMTSAGAIAGIFAAIAVWLVTFCQAGYGVEEGALSITVGTTHVTGIMPVVAVFFACLVVTVGVSFVTRPPSAAVIDRFFKGLE